MLGKLIVDIAGTELNQIENTCHMIIGVIYLQEI